MEPGSTLAGYRIERVLATGGMGTVYLAHDPVLPRLDALKVLDAEPSKNPRLRARFIRESDTAATLHHPNIVSIYSRGEAEDGQLWIAMQYVAGTDAEAALASGTMTPPRALRIVKEVAKALDYAHRLNVVHHDVKPSNFLLSTESDGEDEHVFLGDFGISRAIGQTEWSADEALLTLSLAYAAPEVIVGGPVNGSADIYSLGCTLFRLLTGKQAFSEAHGTSGLVEAHLNQSPPRISDFLSGSSPQLDAVIVKALAKDPDQRFSSARELADAASDALGHAIGRHDGTRRMQSPETNPGGGAARNPAPIVQHPAGPSTGHGPPVVGNWPPPAGPHAPGALRPQFNSPARQQFLRNGNSSPGLKRWLVLGAAAIALIVGLVIALTRPLAPPPAATPTPTPTPTTTTSPEPTPDPGAQNRLAGILPRGYPPGVCAPGGITSKTAAAVLCGPNIDPGGPTSATYTLARDKAALQSAMNDVVRSTAPLICPPNILSPGPWHRTETPTVAVGLVFCGIRGGKSLVAWTNEPELLLSVTEADASGPPLDQLFAWWASHS